MAGVVGGLTSVVTQPVKGAQSDGASGFVKGLFKGVVGTVTKPVTGELFHHFFSNNMLNTNAFTC